MIKNDGKELVLKFNIITGDADIEAFGFKGDACKSASEFIVKALGESTDFKRKSEWFEKELNKTGNLLTNLCG